MSVEKLCTAAAQGNLPEIQAYLKEGVDINGIHSKDGTRAIDFAAQNGHFEILKYLVENGAIMERHSDYPYTNLLYWMSHCKDRKKTQAMVLWLLEDERYQKLVCNLHENHLYAVLGAIKIDIKEYQLDCMGLSPWHYLISANTVEVLKMTLESNAGFVNFFNQDKKIAEGPYAGHNPLMWVARKEKYELLSAIKKINPTLSINFKQGFGCPQTTLLYFLTAFRQWQNLKLLTNLYPEQIADLNGVGYEKFQSFTLARLLINAGQWEILADLVDRDPTQIIDIAEILIYKDKTAYSLALKLAVGKQWSLLDTLAKRGQFRVNLNEFIQNENTYISLALILASNSQWGLLEKFANDDPNQIIHLDTLYTLYDANTKNLEKVSLAIILASTKKWHILRNFANRDPNQYVDLQLTTKCCQGSLAYCLAANNQWNILSIFLGNFDASKEPVNLNATPKNSKISLAQLLVEAQQIDLLIKLLSHPRCKIDAEHPFTVELISLLLNCGKESLVNDIMDRYSETEIVLLLNHLETIENPEIKQQANDYLYYYLTAGYEKRILITDENQDSETLSNCVEAAQGLCDALSKIEKKSSYYPRAQFIKAHFLQALLPYPAICDALLKEVPGLFPSLISGGLHSIAGLPVYYQVKTEMIETYYLAGLEGVLVARNFQKEMMYEIFRLKENQPTQESNKKRKPDSDQHRNENSHNNSSTFFSADKKGQMNGQEPTLTQKKFDPNNNNNNCN